VLINILYVPVRLVVTIFGAFLGGFSGFITLGDLAAAESMWGLTDGSAVITPEMLEGTEEFRCSAYDCGRHYLPMGDPRLRTDDRLTDQELTY
jgi:hypothetical protein